MAAFLWYNPLMQDMVQKALDKVVSDMNKKRKATIEWMYDDKEAVQKWMNGQKKEMWNSKPKGQAGWKHIAFIPTEIDNIFTKMYGADYFKDKDFFERIAPEWKIVKDSRNR